MSDLAIDIRTDGAITTRHAMLVLLATSTLRHGVALCVDPRRSILGDLRPPGSFLMRWSLAALDRRHWPSPQRAMLAQLRLQNAIARHEVSDYFLRQPEFELGFSEMREGSLRTRFRELNEAIIDALRHVTNTMGDAIRGDRGKFRRAVEEVSHEALSPLDRRVARGAMTSGAAVLESVVRSLGTSDVSVGLIDVDERPARVPI